MTLTQANKNFNITGRLVIDEKSSVHITLNPEEVNINYNPNILLPSSTTAISTIYTTITMPTICTEAVSSSYITSVVGGVMAVIVIIVIIIFTTILIVSYLYKRKEITTNSHYSENTLANPIYQESIPANYTILSQTPKTNSTEETYSKLSYPFDTTAITQQPKSLHQTEASTMNLTTPNYHIR